MRPDYQQSVTFAGNKSEPVYNWFYYKEGFSRSLVWGLLDEFKVKKDSQVIDPFCGTGTTLLACRHRGYSSVGFDILPLGVFVSNAKVQTGYNMDVLKESIRLVSSLKFGESSLRWPDLKFLDMRKVFSRYARNDVLFFKERILEVEDGMSRNFLLLGLLSIVGQASNTKKDGGVLKIVKKRHLAPVRYLLKNRLKRMYKDLLRVQLDGGAEVGAHIGDARSLELPPGSADVCITSPPYLNFVDYAKLYALELALLVDSKEYAELRSKSLRSHVGAAYPGKGSVRSERLSPILDSLSNFDDPVKSPVVVRAYFEDIYASLESLYSVLSGGGLAFYVVGNACLPNLTVDVDLILAELAEQAGFEVKDIWVANARWCDVHGIQKQKPVRESIVILKKPTT